MTSAAVHEVRLFPKTHLDGTTATSADIGLGGPLRSMAWAIVIDDAARFGVHMLIDSHEVNDCARLALLVAPVHLGRPLTSGIWAVTTGRIDDAVVGTYPVPAEVADTVADLDVPVPVRGPA